METCTLLCFHVHIYRKTCMFPCNLVLTFDPTGKGSIGTKRSDLNYRLAPLYLFLPYSTYCSNVYMCMYTHCSSVCVSKLQCCTTYYAVSLSSSLSGMDMHALCLQKPHLLCMEVRCSVTFIEPMECHRWFCS